MSVYDIDPVTRDLVLDGDGQIQETESIIPELLLAIGLRRGQFHGDPEAGSDVQLAIMGEPPLDSATFIEGAAETALQRLVDQSLATVQSIRFIADELLIDVLELPETLTVGVSSG